MFYLQVTRFVNGNFKNHHYFLYDAFCEMCFFLPLVILHEYLLLAFTVSAQYFSFCTAVVLYLKQAHLCHYLFVIYILD